MARFLPALIVALLGLTAWIVVAAVDLRSDVVVSETSNPGWEMTDESDDSFGILTHGSWQCPNVDCRFRALSGGKPYRSAASQDCALCRNALIQSFPTDAAP